jgi:hypothetical protein
MGEKRNAYRILVGKPEGERHRWVVSIKIDFRETGLDGMDWIDLAQNRDQWRALVNTVMTQTLGTCVFRIEYGTQ